jgi:hypothetical protein
LSWQAVFLIARVAELVDALDLGSSGVTRESSSLSFRTIRTVGPFNCYPALVAWRLGDALGGFAIYHDQQL